MRELKAAFFDLDGTLIDTEGQYTLFWESLGRQYCPNIANFAHRIKGMTLNQILQCYFPDARVQQTIKDNIDRYERQMTYTFFPGAEDYIHDLRGHGVQCALVTSSNQQKMESLRTQIPDIDLLFDLILTAEHFAASKPSPDCYLQAARLLEHTVDECVVFEDAINGLQAGMASGCFTIGVATSNSRTCIENRCHYVIDGFVGLTYQRTLQIVTQNV